MENNNNLPIDDVKMEQEPVQQPAEMTGEYPSYASVTPVKKKSNVLKPVLITSGAVVAAGAVAAFGFGSDIKCAVMGEAKYANSVMDRTVDKFVGETTSAEVASAVVSYAQPMLKTFAVMNKCETEEEQMAYTFA